MKGGRDSIKAMVEEFGRRRDIMVDGLNAIPGVRSPKTMRAFYAFANIRSVREVESTALADYLLQDAGVPRFFSANSEKVICAFPYANSRENKREAVTRMGEALARLK